jgi:hypothetical protein
MMRISAIAPKTQAVTIRIVLVLDRPDEAELLEGR